MKITRRGDIKSRGSEYKTHNLPIKRPIQLCHRWSHRQYKLLSDMFRQELKTFWSSESFPLPPPLISLLIGNDKTPDKPLFRRSRLIKDRNGDSGGHFSFPAEEEDCSMGHLTALVLTLVVYLSLCDGAPTTASSEDHQIAEVSTQMPYMYSYVSYLIYTLMLENVPSSFSPGLSVTVLQGQ